MSPGVICCKAWSKKTAEEYGYISANAPLTNARANINCAFLDVCFHYCKPPPLTPCGYRHMFRCCWTSWMATRRNELSEQNMVISQHPQLLGFGQRGTTGVILVYRCAQQQRRECQHTEVLFSRKMRILQLSPYSCIRGHLGSAALCKVTGDI